MKKAIIQNLTQIALIVFSVVLGLYLSERIEAYKNKKDAANILSKVKAEVNDNRRIIDYWSPYHQEIKAKLDSLIKEESFVE